MIKLPILVTTKQDLLDGKVVDTIVTDTLFVSDVRIDFVAQTLQATIKRGTMNNGTFVENFPPLFVSVNTDGSFSSLTTEPTLTGSGAQINGAFSGNPGDIPAASIVQSLAGQFDQLVGGILTVYAQQAQTVTPPVQVPPV